MEKQQYPANNVTNMNHLINCANAKDTNPITSHFNKFL